MSHQRESYNLYFIADASKPTVGYRRQSSVTSDLSVSISGQDELRELEESGEEPEEPEEPEAPVTRLN